MILRKVKKSSYLFDEEYYLGTYPDVASSTLSPYEHFIQIGALERRNPCVYFDTEYYLSQVDCRMGDPTEHYKEVGLRLGAEPHPCFDRDWYLSKYEDVAKAGVDPLWHYIRYGRFEGRKSGPDWRYKFAGARRKHWSLRENRTVRQSVKILFRLNASDKFAEIHSTFAVSLFFTDIQLARFCSNPKEYADFLRPESALKGNVVLILKSSERELQASDGLNNSFQLGSVFSLSTPDSYELFEFGAGQLRLTFL